MRSSSQAGFTLLELMATVAVLGVLLGIAVPVFTQVIRSNRTASQTNDFVGALSIARSEATKRGMPVSLCAATADHSACAGATVSDWGNGWLVFTDRLGTSGAIDTGDEVLQEFPQVPDGLTVTSNSIGFVRFGATGVPTEGVDVTFTIKHDQCSGDNRRTVDLERTGRVNTTKVSCT